MDRYCAIKNGKIISIAVFDTTPINNETVSFIPYSEGYKEGDFYDIDTDTHTSSFRVLNYKITTNPTLEVSESILLENDLMGREIVLFSTGSENEIIPHGTASLEFSFNKDVQEISSSYLSPKGFEYTNYQPTSKGFTFDFDLTKPLSNRLSINFNVSQIKDVNNNLLDPTAIPNTTFELRLVKSGSIEAVEV